VSDRRLPRFNVASKEEFEKQEAELHRPVPSPRFPSIKPQLPDLRYLPTCLDYLPIYRHSQTLVRFGPPMRADFFSTNHIWGYFDINDGVTVAVAIIKAGGCPGQLCGVYQPS
jgi:hypothetical protein